MRIKIKYSKVYLNKTQGEDQINYDKSYFNYTEGEDQIYAA